MFCLSVLTIRTLGHLFNNFLLYAILPIDLIKIMLNFTGTWMYRIFGTMGRCNYLALQIIQIWYTQLDLVLMYVVTSQSKRLIHLYQHSVIQLHQHWTKMLTLLHFNYQG